MFDTITTTIYRVIQSAVGGGTPISPRAFAGLSLTVLFTGATLISALVYAADQRAVAAGKGKGPSATPFSQSAFASMLRCDPWVLRRTVAMGLLAIGAVIVLMSAGFAKLCALAALPMYYNRIAAAYVISFGICLAGTCAFAFELARWTARVVPTMNILSSIVETLAQDYQDDDKVEALAQELCSLLDTQVSAEAIQAIRETLEEDPGTGHQCIAMILEDVDRADPACAMSQKEMCALAELRQKYGKKAAASET